MNRRDRISSRQRIASRRRSERRGVLLLVVLSMLVLFLLLGTTFLLTSGQYRTASKIVEKAHRTTFQPADLLERALMQLVRDTNSANSAIRYHSLLRDLYGVDGFTAKVYAATPNLTDPQTSQTFAALPRYAGVNQNGRVNDVATGFGRGGSQGQIVELYVQDARENRLGAAATMADGNAVGLDLDSNGLPVEHELSTVAGHYEGCLLTMLAGPCRGQSVRVIGYDPLYRHVNRGVNDDSPDDDIITVGARFRIVAPRRVDGKPLQFLHPTDVGGVRLVDFSEGTAGYAFMVNGRPFSGAGVGLNPFALSSGLPTQPPAKLSMLELVLPTSSLSMEVALAPNAMYFDPARLRRLVQSGAGQPVPTDPYAPLLTAANFATVPATHYSSFAGPGGVNESYDAPDYQNMALAMQALEPRLRGRVVNADGESVDPDFYYPNAGNAASQPAPAYLDLEGVTIPSFHRPDLANFWFHRLMNATAFWGSITDLNLRARAIITPFDVDDLDNDGNRGEANPLVNGLTTDQAIQIAALKRKFLLRPLREDHPDFDGSNPLSRYGTEAMRAALQGGQLVNQNTNEITFPHWEAVGPWDVDNDGDGVNDSIWVDIGLPVQQTEDGRWYKPLVAMLVEDLDGRLNLNAHGSEADMVHSSTRRGKDIQGNNDDPTDSTPAAHMDLARNLGTGALFGNLARDYAQTTYLYSSDQLARGVGWGVAETSLRPIFATNLTALDALTGTVFTGDAQYDDYARLLYGRPDPTAAGRNAAVALRESVAFGRYGSVSAGPVFTSTNVDRYPPTMLTKPGATYVTDSGRTSRQALASVRDPRTPLEFLGYPAYTGAYPIDGVAEAANGFSSAPDLRGRLATGLSGAGVSIAEATAEANAQGVSWRELPTNSPDDSPYELDLSTAARNMPPASLDEVRRSYYSLSTNAVGPLTAPISDDAPFSAAELERILRAFDSDAEKLPDRLWKAVDAFDPAKLAAHNRLNNHITSTGAVAGEPTGVPNSLELVVAGAQAAVTRRQVTTDSWDLPVPNENFYERLVLGADGKPGVPEFPSVGVWVNSVTLPADDDGDGLVDEGDEAIVVYNAQTQSHVFGAGPTRTYDQLFAAGCDDYVVVMRQDPPKNGRLTDYLKYRITLELLRSEQITFNNILTNRPAVDLRVERILFGGEAAATAPAERGSIGGLLSPELLAGRRMDLNRPFGDGRDNNGNGIVDEFDEAGEPFADLNGNGRYDANEPYLDLDRNGAYTASQDYLWVDADGDGLEAANERRPFRHIPLHETFVDRNGVRIYNPQMARQLFARHLYCLMLALTDENYLAPYDSEDPQVLHYIDPLSGMVVDAQGASPESSEAFRIAFDLQAIAFRQEILDGEVTANHTLSLIPKDQTPTQRQLDLEGKRLLVLNRARQIAMRKLTCRMIAQWAINVVDFRDPDSIQTPFEYDENPWDGWNVVNTLPGGRVYPLDGDLTTDENLTMHRTAASGLNPPLIDAANAEAARRFIPRKDWTRGVVWGAERPEVLLTEGIAWHDRRLEDLEIQQTNPTPENTDGKVSNTPGPGTVVDDDLDQLRKPKGFAYVEAYNPQLGDDQRPAELYSSVNATSGAAVSSAGVRLDRLSNQAYRDPQTGAESRSPVWRIAVVEEHPLVRNATVPATSSALGQASDDWVTEQAQQYLGNSILWGPWIYSSDADLTTIVPGISVPLLPNAYRQYHIDKKAEVNFALQTSVELATGASLTDADGIGVSAGVIERAPTVPDTSFPTFDNFAQPEQQPGNPATKQLNISSKINGEAGANAQASRSIVRGILTKPTTFVERVFYMAPAVNLAPSPGYSGVSTGDYPAANLTDPGLRIPLLTYEVATNYRDGTRITQEGPHVGVTTGSGTKSVRVFASKFVNAYDRFTPRQPNAAPTTLELAPLLPGRRAVIGTTGDIYGANTQTPTANELARPFEGPMAMRMDHRYAAIISQYPVPVSGGSGGGETGNTADPKAVLRRLEMTPSSDANRHQFAIRMNGLNESQTVTLPNGRPTTAFNLTGGEATGFDDAGLVAAPPVIAIPIDHFSISEPLDEYLVRQIELDSRLSYYPQPSYRKRTGQAPIFEEYFATTPTNSAGKHFDEPFDIHPELVENQTTPNYRSVHLERLANPLLPWNPPPVRPDGQPIAQHNPAIPVNPYLPVDARSLDLTSFNSFSDLEKSASGTAPAPGDAVGPEQRHKRKRELDTLLGAAPGGKRDTVIGFASNERSRLPGPFPLLWMMEPARLIWRQTGPSTFSEIAHEYASGLNSHNGYLARARDQLAKPGPNGQNESENRLGLDGTKYDTFQISPTPHVEPSTSDYRADQYIDVAWRLTLGFSDWSSGEFHTGSALRWLTEGNNDGPVEDIDLDGDRNPGDLAGKPEINGVLNTQQYDPNTVNGRTTAVNNASLNGTNARTFMESYLRTQIAEQGTTPEFAWPNRPLASAGELLQVPVWGGSRMLTYYSVFNWQFTQNPHFSRRTQVNPYDGERVVFHDGLDYDPNQNNPNFDGDFSNDNTIADNDNLPESDSTNVVRFRDMLGHFGHLMNFFQTARFPSIVGAYSRMDANNQPEDFVVPRGASHFYRVLDYVCVPSRFTATDTLLNIDAFDDAAYAIGDSRQELAAPFNRIDNYREPGRVNLNTIVGRRDANEPPRRNPEDANGVPDTSRTVPRLPDYWSEVYDGLMHRVRDDSEVASNSLIKQGHLGPAWRDVALSRRGYVQPTFNPTLNPLDESINFVTPAGQNQVDYSPMRMHPDFPTLFANPFRAPGEGGNVPLANMVQTGVDATMLRAHPLSPGADGAWGRRGVDGRTVNKSGSGTAAENNFNRNDATEAGIIPMQLGDTPTLDVVDRLHADTVLARFLPDPSGADSLRRGALPDTFMEDAFRPSTGTNNSTLNPRNPDLPPQSPVRNNQISKRSTVVPLFSGASLEPSLDTERNSTQRYMPIQRMSNLATTRSNVYAVWITVGFFEVKQAKDDSRIASRYFNASGQFLGADAAQQLATQDLFFRVYPQGWTLGREIGRDTGEDVRHRGFYVIDRSRPVAFKPGEDVNVSDTVLVRRRIQ